ncbi:biotin--[acetyl-CoA-carboxylase] ligase [Gracilinema caldarium]|uniref:biotin--[acetyl-CoA-carboxylase] ligase n=1 Tax=Gracilinema caldarium TaxID=215591 RepID=UPI0026F056F1|nr:biotin--[acetyl-CoA-carboxylase] ligase [Gracilinema caldarium]
MKLIELSNPFVAPIYHIDETTSTMDEARKLAETSLHGTVVVADYQHAGRGRAAGRQWHAAPGESLLCTLILCYPRFQDMPAALPLRLGVAAALTLEELWPILAGRVAVKWPNDVLIDGKKVCGILCEAEGQHVYAGIGLNLLQREFPPEISHRSISVLQAIESLDRVSAAQGETRGNRAALDAATAAPDAPDRYRLLINLLEHIKAILENNVPLWLDELNKRLYKRGATVRFLSGSADEPVPVLGTVEGVAPTGELLIRRADSDKAASFITGELDVYGA